MAPQISRIELDFAPNLAKYSHYMARDILARHNLNFVVPEETRLAAIARLDAMSTRSYDVLVELHRCSEPPTLATYAAGAALTITELIDPHDDDGPALASDLVCWVFIGTFFNRLFESPRSFAAPPPVRGLYSRILRRPGAIARRSLERSVSLLSSLIRRAWVVAEQVAEMALLPIRQLIDAAHSEVKRIRSEAAELRKQANRSRTRARRLAVRRYLRRAEKARRHDSVGAEPERVLRLLVLDDAAWEPAIRRESERVAQRGHLGLSDRRAA